MSEFLPKDLSELPPDRWARTGFIFEGYQEMREMKLARDANAPAVGAMATDFEVERGGAGPFPHRRYLPSLRRKGAACRANLRLLYVRPLVNTPCA